MLTFDTDDFDMGDVKFGTTKQFGVNVSNSGSAPVTVVCTNSSCNCTTGSMNRNPIDAGGNGIFTINFNSGKAGRGFQTKNISISWTIAGTSYSRTFRFKVNVTN